MRTEEEVIKDFEKLGWTIRLWSGIDTHIFCKGHTAFGEYISFDLENKGYYSECYLDMEEIKLLHELFEIWGWLK